MEYKLDDKIPASCNSIVYVFGRNYHLASYGDNEDTTFRELLDRAIMNRKEKYGSCFIIIEEPLNGKVFQFGNNDRTTIYEHGTVKGYA